MRSAKAEYPGGTTPTVPTVAIAIPIFNEGPHIASVLEAISTQDYPGVKEIWLVDGGSKDGTREALETHALRDPRIMVRDNPARVPAAAINLAITGSRCDILMRMDAHARYRPDAVSRCVSLLLTSPAAGVGMIQWPATMSDDPMARAIVAVHLSRLGIGVARFRRDGASGWVDSIWNGCYWKHVIDEVGLMREDLVRAEDNDFNARIRAKGYGLLISPGNAGDYFTRSDISALSRQYFSNGVGTVYAMFDNADAVSFRHFAPMLLLVSIIFSAFLGLWWNYFAFISIAIVSIYVFSVGTVAVLLLRQKPLAVAARFPVVVAMVHLSYGAGSLKALAGKFAACIIRAWRRSNADRA